MVCGGGVYSALSQVWLLTAAAVELLWRNEHGLSQQRGRADYETDFSFIILHHSTENKDLWDSKAKSSDWSTHFFLVCYWVMGYIVGPIKWKSVSNWIEALAEDVSIDSLKNTISIDQLLEQIYETKTTRNVLLYIIPPSLQQCNLRTRFTLSGFIDKWQVPHPRTLLI